MSFPTLHLAASFIHTCTHALIHLAMTLSSCPTQGPMSGSRIQRCKRHNLCSQEFFPAVLLHRDLFLITPELTNDPAGETNLSLINATPHARDSHRSPESKRCKGGNIWLHLGRSRPPGEMHGVLKGERELARWMGRGNSVYQGTEA